METADEDKYEGFEEVRDAVQNYQDAARDEKEDAFEDIQNFVKDAFTVEGEYQEKKYPKNIDKCKFCPYIDKLELCDKKND